jgi:hypothetical protein
MTRACIEASWGSRIRSGSMRGRCGLRADESRFLGAGGSPRRAGGGRTRRAHELTFPPPSRRHPRALHVSGAIKTAALAASPAPPVAAIFLGLVPAVLTRGRTRGRGGRG